MVKKKKNKPPREEKKPSNPAQPSDLGTPELRQHHKVSIELNKKNNKRRARVRTQIPIEWLYVHKRQINLAQKKAGCKIYELWFGCGEVPYQSIDLAKVRVDSSYSGVHMSEFAVMCWEELRDALKLLDPYGRQLIMMVCVYDVYATDLQKELNKPRYYVPERLRECLNILANHFGYISNEQFEKSLNKVPDIFQFNF